MKNGLLRVIGWVLVVLGVVWLLGGILLLLERFASEESGELLVVIWIACSPLILGITILKAVKNKHTVGWRSACGTLLLFFGVGVLAYFLDSLIMGKKDGIVAFIVLLLILWTPAILLLKAGRKKGTNMIPSHHSQ